jgi:hypothetical protein
MLDLLEDVESAPDRALSVVLVREGIAEVHHDAITQELGDVTAMDPDSVTACGLIRGEVVSEILGIELLRELRRADEVDEQTGDLAPFTGSIFGLGFLEPTTTATTKS